MASNCFQLDKDSQVPLHSQLADLIRRRIRAREFKKNERLPSERILCQLYQVSRITVRQALAELSREGLIFSLVGRGSFVSEDRVREDLQPLASFTEDMRRIGKTASSRIISADIVSASAEQAWALNIAPGEEIVDLIRIRYADNIPMAVQRSWVPHNFCPGILGLDLSCLSLYQVLKEIYGQKPFRGESTVTATLAEPEHRKMLELYPPAAVLSVKQITLLENGGVLEYLQSVYAAERYALTLSNRKILGL